MEYIRDVIAEWPNFADDSISGTSTLFIADREVMGGAYRVVSDDLIGGEGFFSVFLIVESDTPLNRARLFWRRHPDMATRGETWEQCHAGDGTVTRVALLRLADRSEIRDVLGSGTVSSRLRVLLVTAGAIDVDAFARALAEDPALMHPDFRPKGLVPWLLRVGLALGVVVVRPEDGADGSAGLAFYGNTEEIDRIRDLLAALPS